jgi:hypothetical protein
MPREIETIWTVADHCCHVLQLSYTPDCGDARYETRWPASPAPPGMQKRDCGEAVAYSIFGGAECFWRLLCGEVKRERDGWRASGGGVVWPSANQRRDIILVAGPFRTAAACTFTSSIPTTHHERPPVPAGLHGRRPLVVAQAEEDTAEIRPQSLYVASLELPG